MTAQFILVRHGKTDLNDPKDERIRGYSDVPLSKEGKDGVAQSAKYLASRKEQMAFTRILASPLQRAMMSAQILAEDIQADVHPSRLLLPWDLGKLTGEPVAQAAKEMDYYQEYPDIKVPGGESYRSFYDRWTQGIEKMQAYAEAHPTEVLVGVVHSRNLLSLPSIIGRTHIGDVPVKGGPGPESVTRVYKDGDKWKAETLFEPRT